MSKRVLFGWIAMWLGTAIWIYGYFVKGHPALVHWQSFAPWWVADYLPNVESEVGMVLVWLSMVPIYWPSRANDDVPGRTHENGQHESSSAVVSREPEG